MTTSPLTKSIALFAAFSLLAPPQLIYAWSWDSADNALPSLREDLDREIAAYRKQVTGGMLLNERIAVLDRLIGNYKPMGLNVADLETERSRLGLEEKQQALRASEAQDAATKFFDQAVYEYREGRYKKAHEIIVDADRLLPTDKSIKELRRRLGNIAAIVEVEDGQDQGSKILRLAIARYLENDARRSMNALIYAENAKIDRSEIDRLRRLIEADYPDLGALTLAPGVRLIDHKMQLTLEAIYDGRYLSAIAECTDVLDLEPENVTALTRLGSAYFAMNEREKARQIWTKALQHDPKNDVLRKFLYGSKGAPRVEVR